MIKTIFGKRKIGHVDLNRENIFGNKDAYDYDVCFMWFFDLTGLFWKRDQTINVWVVGLVITIE